MAARGETEELQGGETYMEKYTRGVLEVESILGLERLRQVWTQCRSYRTSQLLLKENLGMFQP
jgi:kinesin family protein 13